MKIYNRESTAERIFRGRGWYVLLLPLRILISYLYRFIMRARAAVKRAGGRIEIGDEPGGARVISVGNILVGGGGKTPCSMALAEELAKRGMDPVILTRGYGSRAEKAGLPVVLSDNRADVPGTEFLAEKDFNYPDLPSGEYASVFGDEVTIYRSAGIPVVIDPERRRGAEAARRILHPGYIILDDGFQNISVDKDMDILLLDHSDPFCGGRLLPWGRLREEPGAAARADAVIFTRSGSTEVPAEVSAIVGDKPVFFARHSYIGIYDREGVKVSEEELRGRKLAVYSGIALPPHFEVTVREYVTEPDLSFRFSDHHEYTASDISFMMDRAAEGSAFITTEKDWHKSAELFSHDTDIYMLKIRMVINDIDRLIELILSV